MTTERTKEESELLAKFGEILKNLAEKQGKSLEKIAYEAGVSKSYAYELVQGHRNPSLLIVARIAAVLEVPIWKLLKSIDG